eukprot:GHVU01058531.1.p1 GENE.GHVU01058531.1~~GHVU01058531.1.p1  ORF type:complete len:174 (-),score=3.52 GHVU01058531.1:1249-1770(-)
MNNLVASNTAVHIAIPCGYHSLRPHVEIFHSGKYTYKGGSTYFGEYSDVKNGFGESTYVPQDVDEDNEGSSEPQDKRTERFLGRFKEERKHGDGVFFFTTMATRTQGNGSRVASTAKGLTPSAKTRLCWMGSGSTGFSSLERGPSPTARISRGDFAATCQSERPFGYSQTDSR